MDYIPKSSKVYVTILTNANTWYEVLTEAQAKASRGIKVKSRYTYGNASQFPFDYAFSASPDIEVSAGNGFVSNAGGGLGDTLSPSSGLWCRSAITGCIIEVQIYE